MASFAFLPVRLLDYVRMRTLVLVDRLVKLLVTRLSPL